MADQDFSHIAEIINAALPFVDSKTKGLAELFAKVLGLMGCLKPKGNVSSLSAFDFHDIKIDAEGLLKGIRPICNQKEQEFVDRILNIFNMKRMFEMYNNMMSTMKAMQEFGGFNFGDSGSGNEAENVTSNFTGSNFDSIFQAFSNMSSTQSTAQNTTQSTAQAEAQNTVNDTPENNTYTTYYNPFDTSGNTSTEDIKAAENIADADSQDKSSSNPMNNKMFDMLKAMVPPEQMSTFENLSMLLNSMSYDNNSKQDENKEQNNG